MSIGRCGDQLEIEPVASAFQGQLTESDTDPSGNEDFLLMTYINHGSTSYCFRDKR